MDFSGFWEIMSSLSDMACSVLIAFLFFYELKRREEEENDD